MVTKNDNKVISTICTLRTHIVVSMASQGCIISNIKWQCTGIISTRNIQKTLAFDHFMNQCLSRALNSQRYRSHTHTHTHTRTHTYTHAYTHTREGTYIHTYIHTYTLGCARTRIFTRPCSPRTDPRLHSETSITHARPPMSMVRPSSDNQHSVSIDNEQVRL